MLKPALAAALLSLTMDGAHALDVSKLKPHTKVTALGGAFSRDFFELAPDLYAGKSTFNGNRLVTFVKLDPAGAILQVEALQSGTSLRDYQKNLKKAKALLVNTSTMQSDECEGDRVTRHNELLSDNGLYAHFQISGYQQGTRLVIGPPGANFGGLELLQALPGKQAQDLQGVLSAGLANLAPAFTAECSGETQSLLTFPGLGPVKELSSFKLGPVTTWAAADGVQKRGWEYTFAGVSGHVALIRGDDGLVSHVNWAAGAQPSLSGADTYRWLTALRLELGLPSSIVRTEKGSTQTVSLSWLTSSGESATATAVEDKVRHTRSFSLSL